MNDPKVPNKGNVVGAAFTEPVHKIAQYFHTQNPSPETRHTTLQKAEAICRALPPNLDIMFDRKTPNDLRGIYEALSAFAQQINGALKAKGIEQINEIGALEGMHHIGTLPSDFGAVIK